jgi:hypothetical protein
VNVADLQALVMAGEGRQTIQHLTSVFNRFVSLVRNLRKGKWQNIAPKTYKRLRHLSKTGNRDKAIRQLFDEAWLEARYAWRPLICDAQAAVNLLRGDKPLSPRQTFRGYDGESNSMPYSSIVTAHGNTYEITGAFHIVDSVRAGVLCEARVGSIGLGQQVSITNVVDAAVDLIPFSFVLQWFVNLGGLLYRLRPNGSYEVRGAWVARHQVATLAADVKVTAQDGSIQNTRFTCVKTRTDREPGATPTLFSIDINLNLAKLIDLVAILRAFRF